jgi:Uma2 family endonuclease
MNSTALVDHLIPRFLPKRAKSVRIHFNFEDEGQKMTPDEFWQFCGENRKIRAELTRNGDVIIMPPTGFETGDRNSEINYQLRAWAKADGHGRVIDSSGGYILPNGAVYAPDASWIENSRLNQISEKELARFLPLCPGFVIELRSESDSLKHLREKMAEYIENEARLGWLIDRKLKTVSVYRPGREVEVLKNPTVLSGENVLEGFTFLMEEVW